MCGRTWDPVNTIHFITQTDIHKYLSIISFDMNFALEKKKKGEKKERKKKEKEEEEEEDPLNIYLLVVDKPVCGWTFGIPAYAIQVH